MRHSLPRALRRAPILLAALTLTAAATLTTASPATAGTCSISGARITTWGCAKNTRMTELGGEIKLQDLKSDGYCLSVYAHNGRGIWIKAKDANTGRTIKHCSGSVGTYTINAGFDVHHLRLYRGPGPWGRYATFRWGPVSPPI